MIKNIKSKISSSLMVTILVLLTSGCETTELDLQVSPFELTEDSANPVFVLNAIQTSAATNIVSFSAVAEPLIDHSHLFGTYAGGAGPDAMSGTWFLTYSVANNLNFLEKQGESINIPHLIAIGEIMEAYNYVTLVDYIGTAAYSEAVNPDFPNPGLDSGESIYEAMYEQLDGAIAKFSQSNDLEFEDLFFGGDTSKWIKLANTLKLKMYVQSKLVATPEMIMVLQPL